MKALIFALTFGLVVASSGFAQADTANVKSVVKKKAAIVKKKTKAVVEKVKKKTKKALKKVSAQKATSGDLQTDVKFDDSVLHGQYQTPDEALARVENEKGLSDLLAVRKHFKDRLQTASEQE